MTKYQETIQQLHEILDPLGNSWNLGMDYHHCEGNREPDSVRYSLCVHTPEIAFSNHDTLDDAIAAATAIADGRTPRLTAAEQVALV